VVRLFENEPGVFVYEQNNGTRRRYRTIRIPESVLLRVYRRLTNPSLRRTQLRMLIR